MDINDIQGGVNCMDSLRFYKSPYLHQRERLVGAKANFMLMLESNFFLSGQNSVECGQVSEAQNFTFVSPTGVVTAHFQ